MYNMYTLFALKFYIHTLVLHKNYNTDETYSMYKYSKCSNLTNIDQVNKPFSL